MPLLNRDSKNPLLSPKPQESWQSYATFNGSITKKDDQYHLFYRAISDETDYKGKKMRLSVVGKSQSQDGVTFTETKPFIEPVADWERYGCEDPRVTKIEDTYVICYTALSEFPPVPRGIRCALAISHDLETVEERHLVTPFNAKAMTLFPQKINGKYGALLTVNTDLPPARIGLALVDNLEDFWNPVFWRDWYSHLEEHVLPLQKMNSFQIEVGAVPVETEYGWLFVYANIRNYYTPAFRDFLIEAVLLDKNNPQKVIGRLEEKLIEPETVYEKEGTVPNIVFPSGALLENGTFHLYYGAADTTCCRASIALDDILKKIQTDGVTTPRLLKYPENPILEPIDDHPWEKKAVFNPAAIVLDDTIHILYRAQSDDFTSMIGYASTKDGVHIDMRSADPIYIPRADFEHKKREGVGSGCEDPRLTFIDGKIYMLYTAYNGVDSPRVAMTCIDPEDFKHQNWNWNNPVLISPPGLDDKDACILSEKIQGKYVLFHRIENDIVLDYVDSLSVFDGQTFLRTLDYIRLREDRWDQEKVGLSPPPIKTDKGWLLIYHGVSTVDRQYRVGAMLLSLDDPAKEIARTNYPILEPELPFEREGIVPNVVFPCGMVEKNGTLFVYYGGADRVTCVASIDTSKLVDFLWEKREASYLI
jgi:predicted GH43/DUF377 family glycosyl hydrolase